MAHGWVGWTALNLQAIALALPVTLGAIHTYIPLLMHPAGLG